MMARDDSDNTPRNSSTLSDAKTPSSPHLAATTTATVRRGSCLPNRFFKEHASQCTIGGSKPKEGDAELVHSPSVESLTPTPPCMVHCGGCDFFGSLKEHVEDIL